MKVGLCGICFSVWFISFSIMSSRSNHDVKNVLFFRIHNILPCEHTTLCLSILLLTDIQVVSITWLLLTVVATRNMRGQVCLWDPESNSFGCTWVWNCWIIGSFLFFLFFFLRNHHIVFQSLHQFTFSCYYCYHWHHCLWKGSVTMEIFH